MNKIFLTFLLLTLSVVAFCVPRSAFGDTPFASGPWFYLPVDVPTDLSEFEPPSEEEGQEQTEQGESPPKYSKALHFICVGQLEGYFYPEDFTVGILKADGGIDVRFDARKKVVSIEAIQQTTHWLLIDFPNIQPAIGSLIFATKHNDTNLVSPPCRFMFAGKSGKSKGINVSDDRFNIDVPLFDQSSMQGIITVMAMGISDHLVDLAASNVVDENTDPNIVANVRSLIIGSINYIQKGMKATLYMKKEEDIEFQKRTDIPASRLLSQTGGFAFQLTPEYDFEFKLLYNIPSYDLDYSNIYSLCGSYFLDSKVPSVCLGEKEEEEVAAQKPPPSEEVQQGEQQQQQQQQQQWGESQFGSGDEFFVLRPSRDEEGRAPQTLETERRSIWGGGACSLMPNTNATAGTLFAILTMLAAIGMPLVMVRRRNK